jgi:alpha-ribazole phosphatase/probable phosphoglycerate mutase
MIEITFVRHCEVEEAYKGKYNGHIDIGLSKKGFEDACDLAKKIENNSYDIIYSSDLKRVKETLQLLQRTERVVESSNLREKSWGKHEGMSFEEIVASGIKYTTFLEWIEALDGERVESYTKRVLTYFYKTILQSDVKRVLIVTHAGVIRTIVASCKGFNLEESFSISLNYGDVIKLQCKKGKVLYL